jgi:hypothetical protein
MFNSVRFSPIAIFFRDRAKANDGREGDLELANERSQPQPKRATGSCSQHPACPRIERLARGTRSKWASHGPGTTVLLTGGTLGMSNWSRWSIQIYNLMKDNSDGKGKALCVGCVSVLGAGVARTTTEERSKKRR